MAMTFTIVTYLREELSALVGERAEKIKREEAEKERLAIEVSVLSRSSRSSQSIIASIGRGGTYTRYASDARIVLGVEG